MDVRSIESNPKITPYELGVMHGETRIVKLIIQEKNRARERGDLNTFGTLLGIIAEARKEAGSRGADSQR